MPRTKMEPTITLSERYLKGGYCTDKYQLGYYDYFYQDQFKSYLNSPINILEIGIRGGGSIKIWKEHFHPDSKVYGGDIENFSPIENTTCYKIDMYSPEALNLFEDLYFDIIIDDGPHTYESFEYIISNYYSKIKEGGILIVEDVINPSWVEPLLELSKSIGYTKSEKFNMSGKQKYEDLLQRWKNGLYILKLTK
jgi:23S rRNA U2552 (ribose-2'-O)-methylase RlmE/FtsJ